MVEIRWTDQAIQDIDRIAEYISKDSLKYAKMQTQIFFEEAEHLERFPRAGRMVTEFKIPTIRELVLGNYRLVYRIVSKHQIDILTVHNRYMLLRKKVLKRK